MHLNDSHAMAQIEDLLQELITLQKEEMRRTRNYRLTKFLMGTLPLLLILIASIWGSVVIFQSFTEMMQSNPSIMDLGNFSEF